LETFAEVSGWAAALLTVVFAWPQAIRAWRRSGSDEANEGIALATVALTFQSGLLWTVYGVLVASPFIAVANASVAAAALVTGVACRRRLGRMGLVYGLGPVLVTTVAGLAGAFVTGLLGDLAAAIMTLPQAVVAVRNSGDLEAVSPATYGLLAGNAACWIAYGIAIGDPLVVAPNCITLPSALLILARRRLALRRQPIA